jgi:acyl carrier protein
MKYTLRPGSIRMGESDTKGEIKRIIIEALNLEGMTADEIGDNDALFGEGLGLDSVDALELVVSLEKVYGVKIGSDDATRESFRSVETLAALVDQLRGSSLT